VDDTGPAADGLTFFGLEPIEEGRAWVMPIDKRVCSGTGALFGGAAFGAAVAVLEVATGRDLVWATTQFVNHVVPPSVLRLEVEELARGRRASQARVVARLDGREMFSAVATLGEPDPAAPVTVRTLRPDVPGPYECAPRAVLARHRGAFMERVDARLALAWPEGGHAEDGRSAVWARIPDLVPGPAALAVFGDYVPFGLRQALGEGLASHSLDNSLRVLAPMQPGWVLADIAIHGVGGGFGYGAVHLWDEAGRLLGTAGQSFTCRRRAERASAPT
jgi:acyl-CoA thioesterase